MTNDVRVWLDIENPPQVQYLAPFKACFEALGGEVVVTAQDNSITLELLAKRGIEPKVVGMRSAGGRARRITRVLARSARLTRTFIRRRPTLLVATSRAATLSAWAQGVPSFTFCDYEHVDFRVVKAARAYVFHPDVIDQSAFTTRGIRADRLLPFPGLKESISFSGVDIAGTSALDLNGAGADVPRVLFRPPGEQTHYYVRESGTIAHELLRWIAARDDLVLVYSPRYPHQARYLEQFDWPNEPIVLNRGVPFLELLKAVDLVISSGGTMLREAAYLGLPAYSIFRSSIGQVDAYLARLGRLTILDSPASFDTIRVARSNLDMLPGPTDLPDRLARQMIGLTRQGSRAAESRGDSYAT